MNKLTKMSTIVLCAVTMLGLTGCGVSSDSDSNEKKKTRQVALMDLKAELRTASDLVGWIKVRNNQTELQNDAAFGKLKGKMVVFKGEVREVGKTAFGGKPFVSLKVDKLDMFENINIQFNFKESQASMIAAWGKGEAHVLRGRITGRGDLQDDASCDNAEIVPDEKFTEFAGGAVGGTKVKVRGTHGENATDKLAVSLSAKENTANLSVGNVNINMEEARAAIKAWQKDRWNADLIDKAKKTAGRVSAADLKVEANYKDLQPTFDLLIDDYVIYVNVLDSFADASCAGEAVSQLTKTISFDDMVKMVKDVTRAVDGAKSIKNKAGWRDVLPIGKDILTISVVSASMTNASGILKSIFDQIIKK